MAKTDIKLTVNGQEVTGTVEPRTLLIHFLREQLGLTGPHIGCETSHCGACTVDLNGKSVKSCTVFAVQADGGELLTVEGLAEGGELHALQAAFAEHHGLQCGFCTPGMLIRAQRLLQDNPDPSEDEIRWGISGNLCRCTGYQNIVKAIQNAAQANAREWRPRNERDPDRNRRASAKPLSAASAATSGARKTPASSAARATTWTTSSCRTRCSAISCARPTPTPASSRSTRKRPSRCPA